MQANEIRRSTAVDAGIFAALALVMAATRLHHFGAVPDASWAVFFVAGFYLRRWTAWAFPALMVLAVAVDYFVITASGLDFMKHYCVSLGYWALIPAHFAMWAGGALMNNVVTQSAGKRLAALAVSVVVSVVVCHAFAQGGFYWLSDSVKNPSVAGWFKNYTDWLLPYMGVAASYIGVAALLHVAAVKMLGLSESATARTTK